MSPPDSPERDEYEKALREGRVRGASSHGWIVGVMAGADSAAESGSTTDVTVQCDVCGERIELIEARKAIELARAIMRHNRNENHRFVLSVVNPSEWILVEPPGTLMIPIGTNVGSGPGGRLEPSSDELPVRVVHPLSQLSTEQGTESMPHPVAFFSR
jgi:hypothetical protein